MASSTTIVAVLTVALLMATTRLAEGQSECVANLVPCAAYLNSTENPSTECCNAIRQVVTTQLDCLCGLLRNPGALGGLNITRALDIPRRCNIPADTSACNAPRPSTLPPPATPGGNNGNGVGHTISWMGMPALLFFSALTFFY